MPRVVVIVVVFLAILGVSWWQLSVWLGDDAVAVGRTLYPYRRLVAPLTEPDRARTDIVWLGDSTIMTTDDAAPPYPVLLDRRATRPAGYSSQVVAAPGLDFYAYYALMGPALATRPRLVVMVANLRLFNPAGFRSFNDLVGFVPMAELPRLMTLPYAARGMTAPSLVSIWLMWQYKPRCVFSRMRAKLTARWQPTTTMAFATMHGLAANWPSPDAPYLTMPRYSFIPV